MFSVKYVCHPEKFTFRYQDKLNEENRPKAAWTHRKRRKTDAYRTGLRMDKITYVEITCI